MNESKAKNTLKDMMATIIALRDNPYTEDEDLKSDLSDAIVALECAIGRIPTPVLIDRGRLRRAASVIREYHKRLLRDGNASGFDDLAHSLEVIADGE